jgi:hypothetical protein
MDVKFWAMEKILKSLGSHDLTIFKLFAAQMLSFLEGEKKNRI